jgi:hypothetical protein
MVPDDNTGDMLAFELPIFVICKQSSPGCTGVPIISWMDAPDVFWLNFNKESEPDSKFSENRISSNRL